MTVSPPHKRRRDLLERLPKGTVGVEVGVWKGDFSAELLNVVEPNELHLVDPWASNMDRPHEWYAIPQSDMDAIYKSVVDRFADDPRVHVHRLASPAAADEFPDLWFDWVYIDGDHTYKAVTEDLKAWFPKVKHGGVLCGDDFELGHWWDDQVNRAVIDFADDYGLPVENLQGQFWLSL